MAIKEANILPIDTKGSFFTWDRRGTQSYVEYKMDHSFCL